jgi:hypothetical protein
MIAPMAEPEQLELFASLYACSNSHDCFNLFILHWRSRRFPRDGFRCRTLQRLALSLSDKPAIKATHIGLGGHTRSFGDAWRYVWVSAESGNRWAI